MPHREQDMFLPRRNRLTRSLRNIRAKGQSLPTHTLNPKDRRFDLAICELPTEVHACSRNVALLFRSNMKICIVPANGDSAEDSRQW